MRTTTPYQNAGTAKVRPHVLSRPRSLGTVLAVVLTALLAVLGPAGAHDISIPFRDSERNDLDGFLQQAAGLGAHALLTVKPGVPLDGIGAPEAEAFADEVRDLASGFNGQLLIRFAPGMNASWVSWGQQPAAYHKAFQAVATAFRKSDGGRVTMVWAPYLGKDYCSIPRPMWRCWDCCG